MSFWLGAFSVMGVFLTGFMFGRASAFKQIALKRDSLEPLKEDK